MREYLILRLQGVMQSWGGHTYEDYRPSGLFPSRSGLIGLLAACLGIDRQDNGRQQALSDSFLFAVRADESQHPVRKVTDFHTVMDARKVDGTVNKNPVVSRREYLYDICFTVAMQFKEESCFGMEDVKGAIQHPVYTPFLGRRSCPLGKPLFDSVIPADSLLSALSMIEPNRGTVYSEEAEGSPNRLVMRDMPLFTGKRQFSTRSVFIHAPGGQDALK